MVDGANSHKRHIRHGFTLVELPVVSERERAAFTLVELLVVIAIIGILVALLLPAIQAAREAARRTQCVNNLKQIGLATQIYHDTRKKLPPMRVWDGDRTWLVLILPHMEEQLVSDMWDYNLGCFYDQKYQFRTAIINAFYCPSMPHESKILLQPDDPNDGHSHPRTDTNGGGNWQGSISDYRAVAGSTCRLQGADINGNLQQIVYSDAKENNRACLNDGAMPAPRTKPVFTTGAAPSANNRGVISFTAITSLKSITDGTSKTLLGGEVSRREAERTHAFNGDFFPGYWVGELEPFCTKCVQSKDEGGDAGFGGAHSGVCNFAMCDGSVQAINKDINGPVLDAMATRAGGESYDVNGTLSPCAHSW
jgi:prepilin-type N-terminal cleavage/methylation domain-containing protein/prepilin-type processing-associated H-X9-DG protein